MAKKVFELANEIGIGAIDLVEKLKGLGFDVKNHMVSLDDATVTKAMAELAPKTEAAPKKKVTKKKVAKKATKKKVIKKATASKEEPAKEAVATEEPAKKVVVKKKTVTRKKADIEEAKEAKELYKEDAPKGLQVVSQAPKKEVKEELETATEDNKPKEKEVFKEKMHSFTPIFTPEKTEKKETTTAEKNTSGYRSSAPAYNDNRSTADADSKKRMASLASIVSKKGGAKKDVGVIRAEEGMKLATNVIGRQVYTPIKRKKVFVGQTKKTEVTEVKDSKRVIDVFGVVTGSELAQKLNVKFDEFQNKALDLDLLISKEDKIGIILAKKIADLYDYRVEDKSFDENAFIEAEEKEDKSHLPLRNPIITVMGHVDHGKTTLLDTIRKEKVTSGEAGGITQHIGSYSVKVKDATLTFLDTPGHAAFGAMRQRGADLTDIVILVVASDDGVMPQTKESIKYARKSGSPIIVAINKMDKEGANPERIKQELTEFELVSEDWGGDTMFVPISALNNEGIDELLEAIKLQAEMMDLREDPKAKAEGIVIESRIETGRGAVATVLVQKGTLKKGDAIVCGESYGRARSLMDDSGKNVPKAGPSIPVQILGFDSVPSPGDILNIVKNEREAKKIVENRIVERKKLEAITEAPKVASLEDFFGDLGPSTEKKILNLVVKSDVQGSYEAIKDALNALGNDEVGVDILVGGVGAITDNDVMMAANAEGFILGFNMRPVTSARKMAEQKGIEIRTYSVIYELINDITLALEGMLETEKIEKYIGRAEVRETFNVPKIGTIAGCAVIDGKIERGCNIRVLRDGKILHDGKLQTLKRFKDEVKEVGNGYECGMALENFNDVKGSDIIEAYILEEKARKLDSSEGY